MGCWLLIGGVHLWLLFLLPKAPVLSWAESGHRSSSLVLQFVPAKVRNSIDNSSNTPANRSDNTPAEANQVSEVSKVIDAEKPIFKTRPNVLSKSPSKSFSKASSKIFPKAISDSSTAKQDTPKNKTVNPQSKPEPQQEPQQELQENISLSTPKENTFESLASVTQEKLLSSKSAVPKIIYNPSLVAPPIPPNYPEVARRKKQEGTVWLDIVLDEDGKQRELMVYKSSGVSLLDRAAVYAVSQWKFSQYQQQYSADLITIRIPIEFSLN